VGERRRALRQIRPMQSPGAREQNIFELTPELELLAGCAESSSVVAERSEHLVGRAGSPPASLFEDDAGGLAEEPAAPLPSGAPLPPEADFELADEPLGYEFEQRLEDLLPWQLDGGGVRPMVRKLATSAICALVAFAVASVAAGLLSRHVQRSRVPVDRPISAANPAPSPREPLATGQTPRRRQTGRREASRLLVGARPSRRGYLRRLSHQVAVKSPVTKPAITGSPSPPLNEGVIQPSEPPPSAEPATAAPRPASAAPAPASSKRASPPVNPTPEAETDAPAQGGAGAEFGFEN
jgi:hypothetical protein